MSTGRLRDLAPRLRALLDQGTSLEAALDLLRRETDSPLEALRALREVTGTDAADALKMLKGRAAWRGLVEKMHGDTEAFFDQA